MSKVVFALRHFNVLFDLKLVCHPNGLACFLGKKSLYSQKMNYFPKTKVSTVFCIWHNKNKNNFSERLNLVLGLGCSVQLLTAGF